MSSTASGPSSSSQILTTASPSSFALDDDWEEWDPSKGGTFVQHMIAGSAAGVVEHLFMFPVDTYKTHLQFSRALSPPSFAALVRREGLLRLWRGAPAVLAAGIPSHAAYFSMYEVGKEFFGANRAGHHPIAAGAAGACATVLHDAITTPLDVVKQRLQLGYYRGVTHSLRTMLREEGVLALFRSFPTTLFMNVPHAAVTVAANESLRKLLTPEGAQPGLATFLLAGAGAGALASAVTCPLDVIKTRLQTGPLLPGGSAEAAGEAAEGAGAAAARHSASSSSGSAGAGAGGSGSVTAAPSASSAASASSTSTSSASGASAAAPAPGAGDAARRSLHRAPSHAPAPPLGAQFATLYTAPEGRLQGGAPLSPRGAARAGALAVARQLWAEGGVFAFFQGVRARVAVGMPSVAVSWATYEMVKGLLVGRGGGGGAAAAAPARDV